MTNKEMNRVMKIATKTVKNRVSKVLLPLKELRIKNNTCVANGLCDLYILMNVIGNL